MSEQVIKLSTNAAERIKEIMSKAEDKAIGVRVGVKSGGCAGMSYVMEYAKEVKPNEEVVEDKGVKVLIDPKAIMYLLGTEMDYKKEKFSSPKYTSLKKLKTTHLKTHSSSKYLSSFQRKTFELFPLHQK